MGVRPQVTQEGRTAATALLVLAAWMAGPAVAAPEPDLLCAGELDASLVVPQAELAATPVNTSDELLANHLLKPRVKATAREVFADEEGSDAQDATEEASADAPVDPVSRSSSESEVTPFRRQMYRRDI